MPLRHLPGADDVDYYLVLLDKEGRERPEPGGEKISAELVEAAADGVTDIFVLSHGWKGDVPAAIAQYDAWIGAMAAQVEDRARIREAVPGFKALVVGVHWPSLPWGVEDADAALLGDEVGEVVGGGGDAAALEAEDEMSSERLVDLYADRLADTPQSRAALATILSAAEDPALERQLAQGQMPDELETAYLELFREADLGLDGELGAPGADQESFDLAAAMEGWADEGAPVDDTDADADADGDTADDDLTLGAGDFVRSRLKRLKKAVLGPVRQLSFWTMKKRARTVGESGGHQLLRALQEAAPGARLHLMGHSFGCIVVSSAASGPLGPDGELGPGLPRPVDSVVLVQGALSLWSYASKVPFEPHAAGYFRAVLDEPARVRGPVVATISSFDKAVGTYYPLGAFVGDDQLLGEELPRFGAVGAFGLQAAGAEAMNVLPATGDYGLVPGKVYNVDASSVIANGSGPSGAHSDIAHPETAHLVWEAAIATVEA